MAEEGAKADHRSEDAGSTTSSREEEDLATNTSVRRAVPFALSCANTYLLTRTTADSRQQAPRGPPETPEARDARLAAERSHRAAQTEAILKAEERRKEEARREKEERERLRDEGTSFSCPPRLAPCLAVLTTLLLLSSFPLPFSFDRKTRRRRPSGR